MDVIGRGVIAGFLATLALSAVIDPMTTVARIGDLLPPIFAWILHFFVGSFIWAQPSPCCSPACAGLSGCADWCSVQPHGSS